MRPSISEVGRGLDIDPATAQRSAMPKPELPSSLAEAWEGGYVFDEPRAASSVEARGGMVVAGGKDLYMLRPGDEGWKTRPTPEDIGAVDVVAAEPRGARRYAVSSRAKLAIFFKGKTGDTILRLTPRHAGVTATHLAWGGVKGACALWALNDDGSLMRMKPDLSDFEEMDMAPTVAIASDDSGVVALASVAGHEQRVYVTKDGVDLDYRAIDYPISPNASVQLAVADMAVALAVDQEYVLVSRAADEPFVRIAALDADVGARGWLTGPVAFQGASSDAAILCARWEGDVVRLVRVDPSGAAMSIVEMGGEDGTDAPQICSLSWDASRQTLWGTSPDLGIFRSVPPGAKGKKKVSLS
jgi:hypothetical protein